VLGSVYYAGVYFVVGYTACTTKRSLHDEERNTVQNYNGLSEAEMRYFVPSIYAEQPHEDRSPNYSFYPTRTALSALEQVGFVPIRAMQQKSLRPGQQGFGKHLIELCPRNELGYRRDGTARTIILVNSHNAACSYTIMAGLIRFVCENGLISGDIDSTLRVQHRGEVIENVVAGSVRIALAAGRMADELESWKSIYLTQEDKLRLARYAIAERFDLDMPGEVVDADKPKALTVYNPLSALIPRRGEDVGDSLYQVFNVVQERLTVGGRGGITGRNRRGQRRAARGVTGIDKTVLFNQRLHRLAQEMAAVRG